MGFLGNAKLFYQLFISFLTTPRKFLSAVFSELRCFIIAVQISPEKILSIWAHISFLSP